MLTIPKFSTSKVIALIDLESLEVYEYELDFRTE